MGEPADLGIGCSASLVFTRSVTTACALNVPCWISGLFVPKPTHRVRYQRCGGLDLERPSVTVHWRPSLAVAIVTHLITR